MKRSMSMWNAYVVDGKSKKDRRARLAEVPDEWQASVQGHVEIIRKIQEKLSRNAKPKKKGAR